MSLELFVLGTGGMMPLPGRFLTSVLLRREGELFLFDSGEGTQVSLRKLNLKWKKISAIFISHTHADHVTGLPGILMLSSQVEREEPLYIFGPPRIKEYIDMNRKVLDMYINYEIIVKEISESGIIFKGDGFSVNAFPLDHTKPCIGYSLVEDQRPGIFFPDKAVELNVPMGPLWSELQKGNSVTLVNGEIVSASEVMGTPRSGRKVSFVTDTKYFSEISDYVRDSDLFICEGMFTADKEEDAAKKKHMTSSQAGKIAFDAGGVKKMGLIHYSPRYTNFELKGLLKEAKSIFSDTFLTRDGQTIVIPNED
ncbi:MAG: ribonuclease Z [Spirochaetales bacterium]|nr:ribonuclease Z [Spirochaetales bacterium]